MTNANETSASLFAWMPFYSELATKLLAFKNNRKTLLSRLQAVFDDHPNLDFPAFDGIPDDIDPFTVKPSRPPTHTRAFPTSVIAPGSRRKKSMNRTSA